ncbi:MAG: polysaccharide deacetylase family protein, partial [Planctomycetota bacterium]
MKEILSRLACLFGVDALLRRLRRGRLVVLMFHGVVAEPLAPFCWHQLPVEAFGRQMEFVKRHYRVLPLEQALTLRAAGRLPPRSLAITFDDGYENVRTVAAPVLAALDLPATVFL